MYPLLTSLITLISVFLHSAQAASLTGPNPDARDKPAIGDYIVIFGDSSEDRSNPLLTSSVESAKETVKKLFGANVRNTYQHALHGFSGTLSLEAIRYLKTLPGTVRIKKDRLGYATTPYGLDRINQRDLPLDNTYQTIETGDSVEVYVLDSGVRASHADLSGRIVSGINFHPDGNSALDDCAGHGTSVASIIAGTTYGVAKQANIHSLRVLNCNNTSTLSVVLDAVDYVTNQAEQTSEHLVANMSLTFFPPDSDLDQAVRNSISEGVTYVVSAGNEAGDACNNSPANVAEAITVGAIDSNDNLASFSDTGYCVDIYAAGVGVPAAYPFSDQGSWNFFGTSASAPHAAGVVALLLDENSSVTPSQVHDYINASATKGKVTGAGSAITNRILYSDIFSSSLKTTNILYEEHSRAGEITFTMKHTGASCTLSEGESCQMYSYVNGAEIIRTYLRASIGPNWHGCDDTWDVNDEFKPPVLCAIHFDAGENARDTSIFAFED